MPEGRVRREGANLRRDVNTQTNAFDRLIADEKSDAVSRWEGRGKGKRSRKARRKLRRVPCGPPPSRTVSRAEWKRWYRRYMKSNEWEQKRQQAFRFYGRKCGRCGATRQLQVHHRDYSRIGREDMSDLEVLCDVCHADEHRK